MGTWASLAIAAPDHPSADDPDGALAREADRAAAMAAAVLADIDRNFSSYRADSLVCRYERGEAPPDQNLREVLAACEWLGEVSGGLFTTRPEGPSGRLDVAGYVKGWAIDRAADALLDAGVRNFCLGVGGDWRTHGSPSPDRPWRLAIADPADRTSACAVVAMGDGALATSGRYERGDHVHLPDDSHLATGDPVAAVTVHGPRADWADSFATVGLLLGLDALAWVASFDGYSAALVRPDGSLLVDDAFPLADAGPFGAGFPLAGITGRTV